MGSHLLTVGPRLHVVGRLALVRDLVGEGMESVVIVAIRTVVPRLV